ncbi:MAG: phenylacetate--CoA ligase family protein [Dehalococcoidia bacterium]|nr:phenylacetate--CoA ligase family protein [Dehalococcoidia bacterium]
MGKPNKLRRLEDLVRAIASYRALTSHEGWSRARLEKLQRRLLADLLAWVIQRSPFYRELSTTLRLHEPGVLQDFPIMDKETHMEHFDQIVTDPRLRLSRLHEHIAQLSGDDYYLGEYRVLTTAGTSGHKAVFVYNRKEWSMQQAASMRIAAMMGVFPFSIPRLKIVTIGSSSPLHDSHRLPLSMLIGPYHYHMLSATAPVAELVQRLDSLQPRLLRAFPSILGLLVTEQVQGRLHIGPRIVAGGGEPLTEELRQRIQTVWQSSVFDIYGTQEGLRSVECRFGEGMHLFEDLGIVEVVDEHNKPVADGTLGHKILFTNLFSFTLPIIRYEISDMVMLDPEPCRCGRPLRRIRSIDGRNDDVIYLKGRDGRQVAIHPAHFWDVLESFGGIRQYQVVHEPDGIRLRLVLEQGNVNIASGVRKRLVEKLDALGVYAPSIRVELVTTLEARSKYMGKWKNIVSNLDWPKQ